MRPDQYAFLGMGVNAGYDQIIAQPFTLVLH